MIIIYVFVDVMYFRAEGVDTGEYTEAVRVLSSGLLEMYEPTINQMKSNLKELL